MEFRAELIGVTAKDMAYGNEIEVKLTAMFNSELLAQLGEHFGDHVNVQINAIQPEFEFEEGKEEAQGES